MKIFLFHRELSLKIFDIFEALWKKNPNILARDEYWWPNSRSFEVVVGAILTQQTKWENVEKALSNLRKNNLLSPDSIATCSMPVLTELIRPSGFFNMKAKRLKYFCIAMVEVFGNFETFCESVSREWLLKQEGIGNESADSILCYACGRDIMVVDRYTYRLFKTELDIEDLEYDELQELIEYEMEANYDKILGIFNQQELTLCKIYSIFHGLIVEYCKEAFIGDTVRIRLFE